jgi:Mor family transcriptional regulator
MPKTRDNVLVNDLIFSCTQGTVSAEAAQCAIRALCRYYGGQMLYIPMTKDHGVSAEKLRSCLADAVGDPDAEAILGRIMRLYGNMQIYIPLERTAFRKAIALEIYERYGSAPCTMNDLARAYGITAMHAYRLWHIGRREKVSQSAPSLPGL